MMKFIEAQFGAINRKTIDNFISFINDFLKGGKPLWQRFAYFLFNISSNDKLCDHDMFQLL